jgi:hypothetical protein
LADTPPSPERDRHNVIIRPRATTATLIQLDDLDTEKAERITPHAFMVIRTSGGQGTPGNHQAWVAMKDATPDFARRLRKGAGEKPFADPTASGAAIHFEKQRQKEVRPKTGRTTIF